MPLLFLVVPCISSCDNEHFAAAVEALCFSESLILFSEFDVDPGSATSEGVVCSPTGRKVSSSDILCLSPLALLAKELAILATLSFLITVEADVLTRRSLLDRPLMPEKGRIS